jgi:hypothetical protein
MKGVLILLALIFGGIHFVRAQIGGGVGNADPNLIEFEVFLPDVYLHTTTVTARVAVAKGLPSQMALVVNSLDFDAALWQPFSSNVIVPLSNGDGEYSFRIGLRGPGKDAQSVWSYPSQATLDTVPPTVVITNPTTNIISQPMVDLRGFAKEQISRIDYDLVTAAGGCTNVLGYKTHSILDYSTMKVATNWFECSSLSFTNGSNVVTLRVEDRAGNVATNVYVYILDYSIDNTPPVLTFKWPLDGGEVTGNKFTFRGFIDDPTAKVVGQIVDTNGFTNTIKGLVEMNGLVWVEDLPLGRGSNFLTLTMTDAAGNSATTNLTVIGDPMLLSIDPVSEAQLRQAVTTITGKIDTTNMTVWVNGIKATSYVPDGEGIWKWRADEVPIGIGGTAVFQARAIPNSDHGGNGDRVPGEAGNPERSPAKSSDVETNAPPRIHR